MNDYCDKYPENYFVISTRPYGDGDFTEFERFTVLSTCGMNKSQAMDMISKLDYECSVKKRFTDALDKELYENHESFASNPLLLTIMFLTYDDCAQIPEKLHLFYDQAFATLLSQHDARKEGYIRELKSKLPRDFFKTVFSHFCCLTYYHSKLEFSHDELVSTLKTVKAKMTSSEIAFEPEKFILDLTDAVCMLSKEGHKYRFVHRSFQEYFTAVFLKEQFDEDMRKLSMQIIKKDSGKATCDSTFTMLHDMTPNKFKKKTFCCLYLMTLSKIAI